MRVLQVHNFYGAEAPSGENQVVYAERAMLEKRGHEVQTFARYSDDIRHQGKWGMFKGALATPWNPWMLCALRQQIVDFIPDVVHVHNTFPLISPSIFYAIGKTARCVLTLHNYRLFCPAAIPMRGGKVCTECMDQRTVLPSIRFACYRGSRLATLPLAASVALHRRLGTWTQQVDAFIALSEFQKGRMAATGLPREKIHVKPNYFPGSPVVVPWQDRDRDVVFVGRLSQEKGVEALVSAWRTWGESARELRIIGEGPLRQKLQVSARGLPIRFLGQLKVAEAQSEIARSLLLILPSEWFEGFPMVLCEAFAFGTPVAVSDLGPLPFLVRAGENGVVFNVGDAASLLNVVRAALEDQETLELMGRAGRCDFERLYSEDVNYKLLIKVYEHT